MGLHPAVPVVGAKGAAPGTCLPPAEKHVQVFSTPAEIHGARFRDTSAMCRWSEVSDLVGLWKPITQDSIDLTVTSFNKLHFLE